MLTLGPGLETDRVPRNAYTSRPSGAVMHRDAPGPAVSRVATLIVTAHVGTTRRLPAALVHQGSGSMAGPTRRSTR